MTAMYQTVGVARSNIARRIAQEPAKRRGRPPLPDEPLLSEIMAVIAEMPFHGYPRVWAVLRRQSEARGEPPAKLRPATPPTAKTVKDLQAPWQKASIKNAIGSIRRFLARKPDFTGFTQNQIRHITHIDNHTPR